MLKQMKDKMTMQGAAAFEHECASRNQISARARRQQEKLAMLGKLTAGIAHELNNPAAAVQRITQQLRKQLLTVQEETLQLQQFSFSPNQLQHLMQWQKAALVRSDTETPLSLMERSQAAAQLGNWLFGFDLDEAWEMAETFVHFHITIDMLQSLIEGVTQQDAAKLIVWEERSLAALRMVDEVVHAAERISELVAAVKANSHMESGPPRRIDIHSSIDNSLLVLSHKLKNIDVTTDFDPTLSTVMARNGELYQVWTNLIDNAVDALEGFGKITIRTHKDGEYAEIHIEDNGPGIPPEIIAQVFEPFFTTKQEGLGTGLGLEIVQRIVTQHGGTVAVESRPGMTRFSIRLPIHGVESLTESDAVGK